SGYERKLSGGIVITGGGAQLKHLVQLVEYVTGLECRIGMPNEHLSKIDVLPRYVYDELKSPLYATGIGLLIKGIDSAEYNEQEHPAKGQLVKGIAEEGKKSFGFLDKIIRYISDDNKIEDTDYIK